MVYAIANIIPCHRSGNSHQQGSTGLRVSLIQNQRMRWLEKRFILPYMGVYNSSSTGRNRDQGQSSIAQWVFLITGNLETVPSHRHLKPYTSIPKKLHSPAWSRILILWKVKPLLLHYFPIREGVVSLLDKLQIIWLYTSWNSLCTWLSYQISSYFPQKGSSLSVSISFSVRVSFCLFFYPFCKQIPPTQGNFILTLLNQYISFDTEKLIIIGQ